MKKILIIMLYLLYLVMIISTITILGLILIFSYVSKEIIHSNINGSMDTWIGVAASISGGALAFGRV